MKISMIRKIYSSFSLLLFAILIATACSSRPQQDYNDGSSDEEYILIASETEEVQAFLAQFPEAEISVDRSSKLAVDFRVDQVPVTATTQTWEGIRLRVFINPKTKRPAEKFIQCNDESGETKFIEEAQEEYLEQYIKNQSCP